jgi:pimeloyl-ACP methyl ester carboxylesterase
VTLVVLIPALGRGASDYDHLANALTQAAFEPLPLEPDVLGPTLHEVAASVAGAIERRAARSAHVVGHAAGNRVARCLAADRPDLVRSVTLLAAGGLVPPAPEVAEVMRRLLRDRNASDVAFALFAPGNDPTSWVDGWSAERARALSAAVAATPVDHWWLAGSAPLLVVQGIEDRVAVPENGRRLVAEAGTDRARLVEIAGAGHALLPERPDEVAAAVIEFLRGQE